MGRRELLVASYSWSPRKQYRIGRGRVDGPVTGGPKTEHRTLLGRRKILRETDVRGFKGHKCLH